MIRNEKGFTIIELFIALGVMVIGFMAAAQMQFLSLKQKQMAEVGSIATNAIQFVADMDMAEVKRLHLLNTHVHTDLVAGRVPDFSHCDGAAPTSCTIPPCEDPCSGCPGAPCDVFENISENTIVDGTNETTCTAIENTNFDPEKLDFVGDITECTDLNADLYVIKNVIAVQNLDASGLQILTLTLTYAVKTPGQFSRTGLAIINASDGNRPIYSNSLVAQQYVMTAHIDDWSGIVPGWAQVRVPHVP